MQMTPDRRILHTGRGPAEVAERDGFVGPRGTGSPNTYSCLRASGRGLQRTEQLAMVNRWPTACVVYVHFAGSAPVHLGLSGAGPQLVDRRLRPWRAPGLRAVFATALLRLMYRWGMSESHRLPARPKWPRYMSWPDVPDNGPLTLALRRGSVAL